MNLDQSQTLQMIILVVVLALILIPLNIYQNKVGKNLALTITIIVLLGGAFSIYYIMDESQKDNSSTEEAFDNEYFDAHEPLGNNIESPYFNENVPENVPENVNVTENINVTENVTEIVPSSENLSRHAAANLSGLAASPNVGSMINSGDLLPKDDAGNVGNVNLLVTDIPLARFGIDTAGPNKNGLRDLRSVPPVAVLQVSPWNNPGSAGQDLLRRPLEGCQ